MIGSMIGQYKIEEKLGEGGMGVVFKALDTRLDRPVALKFLPEQTTASKDDRARFAQEAKAAASLSHPNICTIHGIEESDGRQFIVMEYVEGKTLGERQASLSRKQAIDIAVQISEGLAAAHDKGIVHRDIKPDNIMIRKDGIPQIMDFGLAKLRGASNLTQQGSTVGTARYMSPEQVQGADLDHRSDIFSLGVLLYEMFAGQLPFRGVHETALMYEIVNVDAAPLASVNADIPPELDEIVLSCLAKDPKDRFQSAGEIARVLRKLKKDTSRIGARVTASGASHASLQTPGSLPIAGLRKTERLVWMAATIVLLAIAGGSLAQHMSEDLPAAGAITFQIPPPTETATFGSLALSPDGTRLAYTVSIDGVTKIWIRPLNELESYSVSGTEGATYPFWSPDGQHIAFFAEGKLKRIDIGGGAPRIICDAPIGRGGSWGDDGDIIFAPTIGSVIHRVAASGGLPEPVTTLDTEKGENEHIWPTHIPGSNDFLYSSRRFDHDYHMIHYESFKGVEKKSLTVSMGAAAYSTPGYIVYVSDLVLQAQPFDPQTGAFAGEPIQLGKNPGFVPITGQSAYTISRNGVLATGGGRVEARQYTWFDRAGTRLGTVSPPGNFYDIDLSPDGRRAAVQHDLGSGFSDIYVIDLVQKTLTQFTFTPEAVEDNPIWSPDGSFILFNRISPDHPSTVFRKRSTGAGAEQELVRYENRLTDWSHDGRYILFDNQGTGVITYSDTRSDSSVVPFITSPAVEIYGHFSPDGRYVAYASNESGIFQIYVQTFPEAGGKWRISEQGGSQPEWRGDGGELFYIAPDKSLMVSQTSTVGEFRYTRPTPLFRTRVDDYDAPNRYVPANDGTRFLINVPAGDDGGNPVTITVNWLSGRTRK